MKSLIGSFQSPDRHQKNRKKPDSLRKVSPTAAANPRSGFWGSAQRLCEGIDDLQLLIDDQAVLHVFGVKGGGAGSEGAGHDQTVPVGDQVSCPEVGSEAQKGAIEFDHLAALVESVDERLDLSFGEGGFLIRLTLTSLMTWVLMMTPGESISFAVIVCFRGSWLWAKA
jgi:hypothetical protein